MLYEAEENKGKYLWKWAHYIGDVLAQNKEVQKEPAKIGEGALGRKIASIPCAVYRSWQREFEQRGGKSQDKWVEDWGVFLRRKINEHPEFRTVDKMLHVTPNPGNTIIK